MQPEGWMQVSVFRAERLDAWPTLGIHARHDHGLDAGLLGAFDHRVAVDGERRVIEMDVAVDQSGRAVFFVHWQRVPERGREDNVTTAS